jgi:rhamnose utilization protein RhaD (predicted bifunctional aldolase and dehydrogenase)
MDVLPFPRELDHLLHISHVLGCSERLVQAGGGNSSVKCADGRTMLIKASGTPLGAMSPERGWVAVDMERIRTLFADASLRSLPAAEREKKVLGVLYASVVQPRDARPSVETPLHVLLDSVVMHSHPVAGNALTCHPDGEKLLVDLFSRRGWPPALWVSYVDPGATLAFAVADLITRYRVKNGAAPGVIVLQNHGIFVAAADVSACVHRHQEVLDACERLFVERQPVFADAPLREAVEGAVRDACRAAGVPTHLVRYSRRPELLQAAMTQLRQVYTGALSPDHVVYTGPCGLVLDPPFDCGRISAAIGEFHRRHGIIPRLVVLCGQGMCIVAESEKKLDAAESLAVTAAQATTLAGEKLRFLREKDVSFIMNWEAEHYRAKQ